MIVVPNVGARRGRTQGFVLVNALVLVAALAGVAVFLLMRAEAGRLRLEASQNGVQLSLYLDSFEALAMTVLDRDGLATQNDHLGEAWAKTTYTVPVDRGHLSGEVTDMQALFNLNWLVNPSNEAARAGFDRLLTQRGISPQTGAAIVKFMRPGGPEQRQAYARASPSTDPVGGALMLVGQLRDIPQISPKEHARLVRVVTVLPGDSTLNINTAPAPVLSSLLPQVNPAVLARVLAQRPYQPFTSVSAFVTALEGARGDGLGDDFKAERFTVASRWFLAKSSARLGTAQASRQSILRRDLFPKSTVVVVRQTVRP